ncbi:hypothetical protein GWI33_019589 [Rhynchophorus ferrugineus]|uniref:Uncharacterized protein n=1 Tax=Rhynchophorus ferrugineus TaxID=354439 RepID=A0A834HTH2_RHYFE|nr:hypothetical protein GWI33_019589 [Rhynchophorus ferrugineus]
MLRCRKDIERLRLPTSVRSPIGRGPDLFSPRSRDLKGGLYQCRRHDTRRRTKPERKITNIPTAVLNGYRRRKKTGRARSICSPASKAEKTPPARPTLTVQNGGAPLVICRYMGSDDVAVAAP